MQCIWNESAGWYVCLQRRWEMLSSAYCPQCISRRQNFMMHDFAWPGYGCSQLIMEAQTVGLINFDGSTHSTCKSFLYLESSQVWALELLGTLCLLSCSAIIGRIAWRIRRRWKGTFLRGQVFLVVTLYLVPVFNNALWSKTVSNDSHNRKLNKLYKLKEALLLSTFCSLYRCC